MVVWFTVYPGYPDARSTEEASAWLRDHRMNLGRVAEIALATHCPTVDEDGYTLADYLACYDRRDDLTIWGEEDFREDPDADPVYAIRQSASGGGISRRLKESLRRAVAIYLLTEAAKEGINLNVRSG